MKNLLAISWEMPPLSGPRAVQVTRTLTALGELGWRSRVVCFGARSNRYQQDYRIDVEQLSSGSVTRLPVPSPEEWALVRALWRVCPPLKHLPDEKRVWLRAALAEARRALAASPASVIVSFAQPWTDHLVGLHLHRETRLPWVAHFSDPWVDSPYQRGSAWQRKPVASMERAVVAEANAVVFVNQYTLESVMKKYPEEWRRRAHVVPQGYDSALAPALAAGPPGPAALRIVYTGRFYDNARTPDALLDAMAGLNRTRPLGGVLEVEFVGDSMARYQRGAAQRGLESVVTFTGRVSPSQARARAAAADVLVTIDAPSDGPSLFLPSKVIDYLPLRKPILGLTPLTGPSAELLGKLQYPVVDPRDVAGLTTVLGRLIDEHAAGRLGPSRNHDEIARPYDIRTTTRAFEYVLQLAQESA